MARAVKYNLEARLKVMEEAAKRQVDLATFDMLPRMALSAGYAGRDNISASSSESVQTGTQSLEPSTSQDRDRGVADLTMVWNVLDFGVAYVSAKQQGDQRLIVQERRRKVVHTIIQDVTLRLLARRSRRAPAEADRQPDGCVDDARSNSQRMSSERIGDPDPGPELPARPDRGHPPTGRTASCPVAGQDRAGHPDQPAPGYRSDPRCQ